MVWLLHSSKYLILCSTEEMKSDLETHENEEKITELYFLSL